MPISSTRKKLGKKNGQTWGKQAVKNEETQLAKVSTGERHLQKGNETLCKGTLKP